MVGCVQCTCRSTRIRTAGLQQAYLIAYEQGQDFVTAEKWIKKRRSHRSCLFDKNWWCIGSTLFPNGGGRWCTIIDENDEEEEYINPEEELLGDEYDIEEQQTFEDVGTTPTRNNEEEWDYDYSYNDWLFEEIIECDNCDELVVEE